MTTGAGLGAHRLLSCPSVSAAFMNALQSVLEAHEQETASLRSEISNLKLMCPVSTNLETDMQLVTTGPSDNSVLVCSQAMPQLQEKEPLDLRPPMLVLEEEEEVSVGILGTNNSGNRHAGLDEHVVQCDTPAAQRQAHDARTRGSSRGSKCSKGSKASGGLNAKIRRTNTTVRNFQLRPLWSVAALYEQRKSSLPCLPRTRSNALMMLQKISGKTEVVSSNSCLQPFIIHPNSFKRLLWDVLSMTLLTYDMISVPFVGAFEPENNEFFVQMTWYTLLYWNFDIGVSLLTGYQHGRKTVLAPKKIFIHYLQSWALLDLLIVGLDWALVFIGEKQSGSAARLGRSLRTLRFVRTLRLIRVLKLKRILQEIQDQINTETLSICFGIAKIIISLIMANHIVACCWYAIGVFAERNGVSWVIANKLQERTLAYRYTTSLHWSLTQFTPASMEVFPQNVDERLFSVIVLLFAMIAFSSFVSILTASMAELRNIHNDEARQFWLLRRYLRDWGVSRRVGLRIQHYLEFAYQKSRQRVQEKEVRLLSLLSEPLRDELKYEIFAIHLQQHPLFYNCSDDWMRFVSRSLASSYLARGDVVFSCGDTARLMFFNSTGILEYTLGDMDPYEAGEASGRPSWSHQQEEYVPEGGWTSEATLWTPWVHCGDLQALVECQVVSIDAEQFGHSVHVNKTMWMAIRKYAENFCKELNKLDRKELTDLTHFRFLPDELIEPKDFRCYSKSDRYSVDDEYDVWIGARMCIEAVKRCLCPSSQVAIFSSEESPQSPKPSPGDTRSPSSLYSA